MAAVNHTANSERLATAKVRLSDSAVLASTISLLYALALMIWPRAFPELLTRIFDGGHFYLALAVALVAANEILFVLIRKRRNQKPSSLTLGYIAFLTIAVVFLLWALMAFADVGAQLSHFSVHTPGRHGISSEELLFYTHLGMVSGIFLPYLVIRMTQDYVSGASSATYDANARRAAAGQ